MYWYKQMCRSIPALVKAFSPLGSASLCSVTLSSLGSKRLKSQKTVKLFTRSATLNSVFFSSKNKWKPFVESERYVFENLAAQRSSAGSLLDRCDTPVSVFVPGYWAAIRTICKDDIYGAKWCLVRIWKPRTETLVLGTFSVSTTDLC